VDSDFGDMTHTYCPLCNRELGDVNVDEHHLIPKMHKGKEKEKLHRVCHTKIHSVFTEAELADYYHTWDRLRENEQISKFIKWVQKKSPDWYDRNIETRERNGKRRR
jgi:hypothetical protein